MRRVPVRAPAREQTYEVVLGEGALADIEALRRERFPGHRVAAAADARVLELHGDALRAALPDRAPVVAVPAGEAGKTRAAKEALEDELLGLGLGRDTLLVGFGGGAACDLAGFVAATYARGVPFAAAPTTLLAAVDATVGGKTGVNVPQGKNLVGAIRQPAGVFFDPRFLATLDDGEYRNGIAEMAKIAAARDARFFAGLERDREAILARDAARLLPAVERSVALKAEVVAEDELESGLRQVLNFGHTIGHALERATGHATPHGAAVAVGMAAEAKMAEAAGALDPADRARLIALLAGFGLPVAAPPSVERGDVLASLGSDKKALRGEPRFVVLEAIGRIRTGISSGGGTIASFPLPEPAVDAGLRAIGL